MRPAADPGRRGCRGDRGSSLPLVIGFMAVLLILVAVVVDASAAYLRRQSLDTLADGAALRGADLGAEGTQVYAGGVTGQRLRLTTGSVSRAVRSYLREVGAYGRYPGLTVSVAVDSGARQVAVHLSAPLDLPLTVPGAPGSARVGAEGSAAVTIDPDE
ncbi:pilus assembly protein TadG-related protein [Nocardioides cheoyonin]|uniref:pilus assembly protein TadG-related protein n=1 Tax=Nocardioides cheoyonin TaxID=3156615 RepID=UPI0032B3A292